MTAYKLFRVRQDGSLGPLFIHRRQRIEPNVWLEAEAHPTRGYAYRPGWHCCADPVAPHLKMSQGRVWRRVRVEGVTWYTRPAHQGGKWILAQRMMVEGSVEIVLPGAQERQRPASSTASSCEG